MSYRRYHVIWKNEDTLTMSRLDKAVEFSVLRGSTFHGFDWDEHVSLIDISTSDSIIMLMMLEFPEARYEQV